MTSMQKSARRLPQSGQASVEALLVLMILGLVIFAGLNSARELLFVRR
jgi:hypothetical protein